MIEDAAARELMQFLQEVGDAPEVIWTAALAMIQRALDDAAEARWSRFRSYPQGQLRRLNESIARGVKLGELAVALQEADSAQERGLAADLLDHAAAAAKATRRAQTKPAEIARLANADARRRERAGIPSTNFHLEADYPVSGVRRAEDGDGAGDCRE
jgi:GNAT superfamily N-acetyltransferase